MVLMFLHAVEYIIMNSPSTVPCSYLIMCLALHWMLHSSMFAIATLLASENVLELFYSTPTRVPLLKRRIYEYWDFLTSSINSSIDHHNGPLFSRCLNTWSKTRPNQIKSIWCTFIIKVLNYYRYLSHHLYTTNNPFKGEFRRPNS